MTQLEVAYRYHTPPTQATIRALDSMREVYGVRRIAFDEAERTVRVEFDASRLKEPVIAALLRRTGLDLGEQLGLPAGGGLDFSRAAHSLERCGRFTASPDDHMRTYLIARSRRLKRARSLGGHDFSRAANCLTLVAL